MSVLRFKGKQYAEQGTSSDNNPVDLTSDRNLFRNPAPGKNLEDASTDDLEFQKLDVLNGIGTSRAPIYIAVAGIIGCLLSLGLYLKQFYASQKNQEALYQLAIQVEGLEGQPIEGASIFKGNRQLGQTNDQGKWARGVKVMVDSDMELKIIYERQPTPAEASINVYFPKVAKNANVILKTVKLKVEKSNQNNSQALTGHTSPENSQVVVAEESQLAVEPKLDNGPSARLTVDAHKKPNSQILQESPSAIGKKSFTENPADSKINSQLSEKRTGGDDNSLASVPSAGSASIAETLPGQIVKNRELTKSSSSIEATSGAGHENSSFQALPEAIEVRFLNTVQANSFNKFQGTKDVMEGIKAKLRSYGIQVKDGAPLVVTMRTLTARIGGESEDLIELTTHHQGKLTGHILRNYQKSTPFTVRSILWAVRLASPGGYVAKKLKKDWLISQPLGQGNIWNLFEGMQLVDSKGVSSKVGVLSENQRDIKLLPGTNFCSGENICKLRFVTAAPMVMGWKKYPIKLKGLAGRKVQIFAAGIPVKNDNQNFYYDGPAGGTTVLTAIEGDKVIYRTTLTNQDHAINEVALPLPLISKK